MRRADRLFQVIQFLRERKLTTAKWLSDKLEVSERTIYRDVQHLIGCGVPIDGEAGVGYIMRKGYDLPPLMFDRNELSALIFGARIVASFGGSMGEHAHQALSKLTMALPKQLQHTANNTHFFVPTPSPIPIGSILHEFNSAIHDHKTIFINYQKLQDDYSESRKIAPLGLFFWHKSWTLVGWCFLREDFRNFRLDRIHNYQILEEQFIPKHENNLQAFFKKINVACSDIG